MSAPYHFKNERIYSAKLVCVSLVEQDKNPATDFCGGCFHCFILLLCKILDTATL